MSVNQLLVTVAPAAAVDSAYLTPGRFWGTLSALLALLGVVLGGLALSRASRPDRAAGARRLAAVPLVLGAIGLAGGGAVLAAAEGGPGTGYGVVGAGASVVLGLASALLGGLALARSRRVLATVA